MEEQITALKKKINDHVRLFASQNNEEIRLINSTIKKNTGKARGDMTLDELETLDKKMDSWFPLAISGKTRTTQDQLKLKQLATETDQKLCNIENLKVDDLHTLEARGLVLGHLSNLKAEIHRFETAVDGLANIMESGN